MFKVLVCGGRDYSDFNRLEDELNKLERAEGFITIISGCARGADSLAIKYADKYSDPVVKFPANWDRDGKAAGFIRNQQMLDEGKPDLVLAFPGGRGTADMVKRAKNSGVEVIEIAN